MKHPMATVTQIQSTNKQTQQKQPTPPKHSVVSVTQLPLVTKQLTGLSVSLFKFLLLLIQCPLINNCVVAGWKTKNYLPDIVTRGKEMYKVQSYIRR